MREIKFRGIRVTGSGFIYGSLVVDKLSKRAYINDNRVYKNNIEVSVSNVYEVAPELVQQYIGCLDDNKKEIYEGDIVDCYRYVSDTAYRVVIEDIRRIPIEMYGSNLNKRIVIGNIYENPEIII